MKPLKHVDLSDPTLTIEVIKAASPLAPNEIITCTVFAKSARSILPILAIGFLHCDAFGDVKFFSDTKKNNFKSPNNFKQFPEIMVHLRRNLWTTVSLFVN